MLGVRGEELAQQKTSICYRGHTTQIIEPKIGFLLRNLIYIDSKTIFEKIKIEIETNGAKVGLTIKAL